MIGIGKGGKILSRDCDLIIADDIEDHASTAQPVQETILKTGGLQHLHHVKRNIQQLLLLVQDNILMTLYSSLLDIRGLGNNNRRST